MLDLRKTSEVMEVRARPVQKDENWVERMRKGKGSLSDESHALRDGPERFSENHKMCV